MKDWDVSKITNFEDLFKGLHFEQMTKFNPDISGWGTSHVTTMAGLFSGLGAFDQDLSSWDVSRVTDMKGMFGFAKSFNADLSSWDVHSVKYMNNMFIYAKKFNSDVSGWNVTNVVEMNNMFSNAECFSYEAQIRAAWTLTFDQEYDYNSNAMFKNAGVADAASCPAFKNSTKTKSPSASSLAHPSMVLLLLLGLAAKINEM